MSESSALTTVKLVHTVIWAFFAGCIIAIPVFALSGEFIVVAVLFTIVLLEVIVLLAYGGSCPLTAIAAKYTSNREPNFDIFLPRWLAKYNKEIFGTLYVGGSLYALFLWYTRMAT